MNFIQQTLRKYILSGEERTKEAKKNIVLSLVVKGLSILVSLLVVPMTINYVNPTQYGIWLTISSVIAWMSFFDFGLGNGFRNEFAKAKATGNIKLARQYMSTAYASIGTIVILVFIVLILLNSFVNWASFLNVSSQYTEELHKVFQIQVLFFSVNMVVSLFTTLLTADQKPALASVVVLIGQIASLLSIFLLTQFSNGSLISLASYYAGVPCIMTLVISAFAFRFSRYKQYRPSITLVRKDLVKSIFSMGLRFFVIYLCMLAVFQIINLVISRELGSIYVTQYNIAYKYLSIMYMVLMIIITPFWSSFTDAYTKKDFYWMMSVKRKLEFIGLLSLLGLFVLVLLANVVYKFWIGNAVTIPLEVTIAMAFYMASQTFGQIYMYMINGIGKVYLQTVIYFVFAVLSWPVLSFASARWGLVGVLLAPTGVYFCQALFGRIQLTKILKEKDKGIWSK
ncbi:MAG: oligosaccharide flippase family protein [Bacteroidaceae bacterium]